MNEFRTLALGLALATSATATLAQSAGADRSYRVASFDKVAAAGPNRVVVNVGGAFSVTARGPAETLDKMEVVVERGSLEIRPQYAYRNHFDWHGMKPATYTVTLPRLAAASLAGSGDMRVDRAEGERFAASLAGSGNLNLAGLRVGRAALSAAGSGTLTATGGASRADSSVAGSGSVKARGMASRTAAVSIAGSGNAEVTARETADISIVGSGDATVAGGAHCRVSRIGSGQAHCA